MVKVWKLFIRLYFFFKEEVLRDEVYNVEQRRVKKGNFRYLCFFELKKFFGRFLEEFSLCYYIFKCLLNYFKFDRISKEFNYFNYF